MNEQFVVMLSREEARRAARVAAEANLSGQYLLRAECDGAGPALKPGPAEQAVIAYGVSAEREADNRLAIEVQYRLTGEQHVVFQVDVTFLLVYEVDPKFAVAQKDLDAFARSQGLMASWPYAREFMQNLTARMGLPVLILPTLKLISPEAGSKVRKK
jgi:hypothetical protein